MIVTRKQSVVGIDIGESSTKLIQFRSKGGGIELLAAATLSTPFPTDGNGTSDAVAKELKRLLLKRKFGLRRAIITLPTADVDVRPLTLPAEGHDVPKMVRWEAESYLSYDIENAIIDHIVLGEAKSAGERRLEVLAMAAEQSKVTCFLSLLSRAGIVTEAVDVVPLALARLLHLLQNESSAAGAIVDIGARYTQAVIINGHELRMSRKIDIGGDALTEAIAAALEISHEEANVLKCQHGAGIADEGDGPAEMTEDSASDESQKIAHIINDILRDKLDILAAELAKLFRYFSAQSQGQHVEKVLLVGGGGALRHLDRLLAQRLNTEVEIGSPISQITGRPAQLRDGNEGAYAVAAGLALRGI